MFSSDLCFLFLMASSHIEFIISSSSAPFGYDNLLRDRWSNNNRDSNVAAYKKNFKYFVDSISESTPTSETNNNNDKETEASDLWVHIPTYNNNNNNDDVPQTNKYDDRLANNKNNVEIDFTDNCMQQRGASAPTNNNNNNIGGVSSLLQRWRYFEAEAMNSANNSPINVSRSSTSVDTNNNTISEGRDNESLVDIRSETKSTNEDIFGDWESDRTLFSGIESDANDEKERTRVVDIIRKLTTPGPGPSPSPGITDDNETVSSRYRVSLDLEQQRTSFSPYGDLLMQLQTDRHKELQLLVQRNAVSKFSHKGRIQAMLRVQFLHRGPIQVKDARTASGASLEVNRLPQSSINHLRDILKPISQDSAPPGWKCPKKVVDEVEPNQGTHQQEVAAQQIQSSQTKESETTKPKEILLKSGKDDKAAVSNDQNKKAEEKNILPADSSGNVPKEASSNSNFLQESTNEDNKSCSIRLSVDAPFSSTAVKEVYSADGDEKRLRLSGICQQNNLNIETRNRTESVNTQSDLEDKISGNQHNIETIHYHKRLESVNTQQDWEEEISSNQYLSESEHGWVSDVSHHTQVGWEELHSDYEHQLDGWQDWICDISRPRSEWEGLRQERYQEMLDPFRQKEDICRLLERKSVSSFLSSGLRDNIDRLMISRTQQQHLSHKGNEKYEQVSKVKESQCKVDSELQEDDNVIKEAEGSDPGYYQDDEEDENQVEQQYEESVEYAEQTSSSIPFTSWNGDHVPETNYFPDHVEFSSLQQNSSPTSFQESSRSRPCFSMTNSSPIEMQLFYELRGHMEQLHQEMSEIRNSIRSCMNMQLELQSFVKHDIVAALGRSGQNRGRHSTPKKGVIKRRMCCICYDEQVDSLLYRCGHMCTCFKCANELQCGSGRCPICQAPIIDVVLTHGNS